MSTIATCVRRTGTQLQQSKSAAVMAALLYTWLASPMLTQASGLQAAGLSQQPLVSSAELTALKQTHAALSQQVRELITLTSNAPQQAFAQLRTAATNPQQPALQRDALVYAYTMALRQLSPRDVDPQALSWLQHYRSQRWHSHEESHNYRLPVFDVSAALAGTRHEWSYQDGYSILRASDQRSDNNTLRRYASADAAYRRGFESSLAQLPLARVTQLATTLAQHPQLQQERLGGLIALQLDNHQTPGQQSDHYPQFSHWLKQAGTSAAVSVLRDGAALLRNAELLQFSTLALNHAEPQIYAAGLALSAPLWQQLQQHPQQNLGFIDQHDLQTWRHTLLQQLAHPQRGAAAALHLAPLTDQALVERWQQQYTDPLIQKRLKLISQLHRNATQTERSLQGGSEQ